MQNETIELIDKAVGGDKAALQSILVSVEDMVYNLSLRMLGSPNDNSPLFTILYKKLRSYQYEVVCSKCKTKYRELMKFIEA